MQGQGGGTVRECRQSEGTVRDLRLRGGTWEGQGGTAVEEQMGKGEATVKERARSRNSAEDDRVEEQCAGLMISSQVTTFRLRLEMHQSRHHCKNVREQ